MQTSVDTTTWFSRRNLTAAPTVSVAAELPREVAIYLLVTLALRPSALPSEVVAHLATRLFGHCAEDRHLN